MRTTNKGNVKTGFKIWCETNEIKNKVLMKMEKLGLRWCAGNIATGFDPGSPCALFVDNDNSITFSKGRSYFSEHRYVEINAFEYLGKHKNECIVIYRKGQETIALDKVTGKKAVAKCSPEDEFDFDIGSKLAFERLLGIEQPKYKEVRRLAKTGEYVKIVKPTSVPDNEYKVGDILKIVKISLGEAFYGTEKAKDGRSRCLHQSEYVVLEGYEPPKEEKFLEEFEKGNIYVFRKEIFGKSFPHDTHDHWVGKCDGKVVDVKGSNDGWIDGYTISPRWCEEIGYKK